MNIDMKETDRRYKMRELEMRINFLRDRINSLERRFFILCMAITLLGGVFLGVQCYRQPKCCSSHPIKERIVQMPATTDTTFADSLTAK